MIKSRDDLAVYCRRKLGEPVININVAPEQVDDRIDEALDFFYERHYDATEETWVTYTLTQQDADNGYITIPNEIRIVEEMLPMHGMYMSQDFMSFTYQYMHKNQLSAFRPLDMVNYHMVMQNLNEMAEQLPQHRRVVHTKHMNKLKFVSEAMLNEGTVVFLKVFKDIDPEENPQILNDKWLKQYCTALIKRQWGENMKKHSGVALLGGVTVNGQMIFDEAMRELEQLEEELNLAYQTPVDFFMY